MKRILISGFAAVALLFATTMMLLTHSHSFHRTVATATSPPQTAARGSQLPLERFEDMTLVYSSPAKP